MYSVTADAHAVHIRMCSLVPGNGEKTERVRYALLALTNAHSDKDILVTRSSENGCVTLTTDGSIVRNVHPSVYPYPHTQVMTSFEEYTAWHDLYDSDTYLYDETFFESQVLIIQFFSFGSSDCNISPTAMTVGENGIAVTYNYLYCQGGETSMNYIYCFTPLSKNLYNDQSIHTWIRERKDI